MAVVKTYASRGAPGLAARRAAEAALAADQASEPANCRPAPCAGPGPRSLIAFYTEGDEPE